MYPPPSHLHSRGSAYLGTELPGPHTTLKVRAWTLNPHSIPALWGTRDSFVRSGNQGSERLQHFCGEAAEQILPECFGFMQNQVICTHCGSCSFGTM